MADDRKYWSWLRKVFIPGVFSGRWYNGQEEKKTMYIGNKRSLLVGMARLRQLRVKSSKSFLLFTFKSNSPSRRRLENIIFFSVKVLGIRCQDFDILRYFVCTF